MLKKLCLLLLIPLLFPFHVTAQSTLQEETFNLPGLDGEVSVRYDEWGIPNIYATTPHDLAMAQGFIHAADRWWQMEWFRHQGTGRLSELAGSSLAETDILLRTLGLERNAQNDLALLPQEVLDLLQAYADGVNAWLADKKPEEAAIEYLYLNQLIQASGGQPITEIEPWIPLNSITWLHVMSLGLNGNFFYELVRWEALQNNSPEELAAIAPGYDYETMPLIMEPGWQPQPAPITRYNVDALAKIPGLKNIAQLGQLGLGSNNWVISGALTESGKPLLANDPHISIQMPSVWYENGLHCVEVTDACPYDVSGYSFASTPFVVLGHNQTIGWGATNVGTDVQDLYVLEINPDNPLQYRYEGEWVDMDVITETIESWDSEPQEIQIRMTRFGPVVNELFDVKQPMALRWGAADGNRTFEAIVRTNRASNWDEFQAAMARFDSPAQNFVYADIDGNIGYIMTGLVPKRAAGQDGTVPVDGTTSAFEWQGYVDPMQNPRLFNPAANYIVTANNAVLAPDDFPYLITRDWEYGYRAARIEELLQSYEKHSPETFAAIQFDNYSWAASLLVPAAAEMDFGDERLNGAADWLAEWDFQADADSPQAALFNVFWREFALVALDELPDYEQSFTTFQLSRLLADSTHPLWHNASLNTSDPVAITGQALENALEFMEDNYGADRAAWRWGDVHQARFLAAPLGQLPSGLDPQLDALLPLLFTFFNRETGVSGGAAIINATSWIIDADSFDVSSLPSMRMILDFSDFENSRFIHTTGQSGDPRSPHYDDFIDLWASGQYLPHDYTPETVEAHTAVLWTLQP